MGQSLQPNRFSFTYFPEEIEARLLCAFWGSVVLRELIDHRDRRLINGFIANATEGKITDEQRTAVVAWLDFCERTWGSITEQDEGSVP